ncbi:unnamed protein product [Penicillium salamii]|uniref:Major facilitator superfamily (MFS) profile domain-containing protein n=1 Tax=Penicillium salamii TaxID=1612424 RepID=A0A9W4NM48_9EURO|nr:unnamed protein product [Penicillium salamii]
MTRPTEDVEAGSNGTTANTSTCKETDHLGQDLTPKSSHAEYMDWENDPVNPYNWPLRAKIQQVVMISCAAFTSSLGVSIVSPAHTELMEEFKVNSTVAILPLSLYVWALALGPVVGGPLSETIGRFPVFVGMMLLGSLFTIGAGFCHSFAGVCILRFLAGFCYGPTLSISAGTVNETFRPTSRAIPAAIFVLMPFLGPGLGPVIGSFVVSRKGWRWTQWTMVFFSILTFISIALSKESFHPVIKRRRLKELGQELPPPPPLSSRIRLFATIALLRPLRMMVAEPIVAFISLYAACEFATLFTFFAAVPLVFQSVYHMSLEVSGLIFLAIVIGCLLGVVTILLCNVFFYLPQTARYPDQQVPPEYRLYPALIGSLGLPTGLFWFAWTAKADISWASPTLALMVFAWGNLCVFVSTSLYLVDAYQGLTVASAMSANSLARYGLAAAFPLFTIQMYENLGIGWASSLLGFIAVGLLPIPWIFFKFGDKLRSWSRYETTQYPR